MLTEATARNLARKAFVVDRVQYLDRGDHGRVPLFSWLELSVTDLCNRACVFCPRVDPAAYPNQKLQMPVALAWKIGAELRALRYLGAVVLCGFGEPLLHPELPEIVRALTTDALAPLPPPSAVPPPRCAGRDIRVEIVTNGDRLTAPLVRELVDAGVAYFVVSAYDGPEQLAAFDAIFAEAGCRDYIVRDRWHGADQDFGLKLTNRGGTINVGNQEPTRPHAACYYLSYSMIADWNGDVTLCVQDWGKRLRFGNLHDQSLVEIWTSPALHRRRMKLIRGERSDSPCANCNAHGTLHGNNHAAAWAR